MRGFLIRAILLALIAALPSAALAAPTGATPVTLPFRVSDLSPDGKSFSTWTPDKLCVIDAATLEQRVCADLNGRRIHQVNPESIDWSPDSRAIAFVESPFLSFDDGDLWVMDAASGALSNLTDDVYTGSILNIGDRLTHRTIYEDVASAWSPDGKTIAFSRSPIVNGKPAGNVIATIPAAGGTVKTIATVSASHLGLVVGGLAWTPDGASIVYTVQGSRAGDPQNGVWMVGASGGEPRQLVAPDASLGHPLLLSIGGNGRSALIVDVDTAAAPAKTAPAYWLLDLKSGKLSPLTASGSAKRFIGEAIFSPNGASLLFTSLASGTDARLIERDLANGSETALYTAPQIMPTALGHGLNWTKEGAIFAATSLTTGVLLKLSSAAPPSAPPPRSSPSG